MAKKKLSDEASERILELTEQERKTDSVIKKHEEARSGALTELLNAHSQSGKGGPSGDELLAPLADFGRIVMELDYFRARKREILAAVERVRQNDGDPKLFEDGPQIRSLKPKPIDLVKAQAKKLKISVSGDEGEGEEHEDADQLKLAGDEEPAGRGKRARA